MAAATETLTSQHGGFDEKMENLHELIRQTCARELSSHAGTSFAANRVQQPAEAGYRSGFWMGIILLAGEGFHMTLKVFYNSAHVKALLASRLRLEEDKVQDSLVTDFVSELCNRAAGGCKRVLDGMEMQVGISLPLISRSFDDIFSSKKNSEASKSQFNLVGEDSIFRCEVAVEALTKTAFENFNWLPDSGEDAADEDDDDMEFL